MIEAAALEQRLGQLEAALHAAGRAAEEATARAAAAEHRAAAAEGAATHGATAGGAAATARPLVDTRLLGRPKSFDGREASWRTFRFGFLGYCAAVDPELRAALAEAEQADLSVIGNAVLDASRRRLSTQVYYMLALLAEEPVQRLLEHAGESEGFLAWRRLVDEFEPRTAGRQAGLLLGLLRFEFAGEPRTAMDEFDLSVREYEKSSGEQLSESLKVALVQKGLRDEGLRAHLVLHAARLPSYQAVRDEVRSILQTRHALASGPAPMDIGAVEKGKAKGKGKSGGKDKGKGKSGGKDKGKGKKEDAEKKPDSAMVCFYCHKKGHRKADCRALAADRQKKPAEVNALTDENHGDQAWIFALEAIDLEDGTGPSGTDSLARCQTCHPEASDAGLGALECDGVGDEALLCEISASNGEWLMVDSGAAVSACPLSYAPEVALAAKGTARALRSVTGAAIEHSGSKAIEYVHENGAPMKVGYEVADVQRPIVAVNNFVDRGMTVVLTRVRHAGRRCAASGAAAGDAPRLGPLLDARPARRRLAPGRGGRRAHRRRRGGRRAHRRQRGERAGRPARGVRRACARGGAGLGGARAARRAAAGGRVRGRRRGARAAGGASEAGVRHGGLGHGVRPHAQLPALRGQQATTASVDGALRAVPPEDHPDLVGPRPCAAGAASQARGWGAAARGGRGGAHGAGGS